jgi:glycerophosphoryl diester phosphodiesterase
MKFSWVDPRQTPLIIAHRGSSAIAPENTIAAFKQAAADGANAIELDIHLTKDGEIAVIHDSRLDRTTSGRGLVRNKNISDLKQFDAGSWFHQKFANEKIPTLREVCDLLPNKIGINVEIKTEPFHRQNMLIVDRCVELIEAYKFTNNILISSVHLPFIKRVKQLSPRVMTGLLYNPVRHVVKSSVSLAVSCDANYLILNGSSIDKRIIEDAHSKDLLVGEYVIDTERRVSRALRFGIDALITNNTRKIRDLLSH